MILSHLSLSTLKPYGTRNQGAETWWWLPTCTCTCTIKELQPNGQATLTLLTGISRVLSAQDNVKRCDTGRQTGLHAHSRDNKIKIKRHLWRQIKWMIPVAAGKRCNGSLLNVQKYDRLAVTNSSQTLRHSEPHIEMQRKEGCAISWSRSRKFRIQTSKLETVLSSTWVWSDADTSRLTWDRIMCIYIAKWD